MKRIKMHEEPKVSATDKEAATGAEPRPSMKGPLGWNLDDDGLNKTCLIEQDNLLNEMLKKRRSFLHRKQTQSASEMGGSSTQTSLRSMVDEMSEGNLEDVEAGGDGDHARRNSTIQSTSSSESSSALSSNSLSRGGSLKGVDSVNTFIRERILFHGPKPYMEEYEIHAKTMTSNIFGNTMYFAL